MSIESVYMETLQNYGVGGEEGGRGRPALVRSGHFNMKPLPHWIQGLMYLKLCIPYTAYYFF